MLTLSSASYSRRKTASRSGVRQAWAMRSTAAWIFGCRSRKAVRIVATFHTKMPEFQKYSPEATKRSASSLDGFSRNAATR